MSSIQVQLTKMALGLVRGEELSLIDCMGLAAIIKIDQIKKEFLPGTKTISGQPKDRKAEIFRLTEALWGVSPARWLEKEQGWLETARTKSGSEITTGKDSLDDVISAEILVRMIATIKLVDTAEHEGVRIEALNALNLVLNEAVSKGRTRIARIGEKSVYSILKNAGVMVGTGGGKYLPDPETSLPYLFQMLSHKSILASVYR